MLYECICFWDIMFYKFETKKHIITYLLSSISPLLPSFDSQKRSFMFRNPNNVIQDIKKHFDTKASFSTRLNVSQFFLCINKFSQLTEINIDFKKILVSFMSSILMKSFQLRNRVTCKICKYARKKIMLLFMLML